MQQRVNYNSDQMIAASVIILCFDINFFVLPVTLTSHPCPVVAKESQNTKLNPTYFTVVLLGKKVSLDFLISPSLPVKENKWYSLKYKRHYQDSV